jgi:CheY-like chemotaxis protein
MPKSLLLADDSITIQKVVQITFASEDFQIIAVDNGDAAMQKIAASRPDIVLADVVMPGKNGYDLCQAVKTGADTKGVPVILLAGTFEPFDSERAKSVGADDFIVKPFETQALIDKVKRLVGMEPGTAAAPAKPAAAAAPVSAAFSAPPPNPAFAKGPVGNATPPITAPPVAKPAAPAATPFGGGPGPLPAFGQQAAKPAAVPPAPAKDPFGMGPAFGATKPATPAFPQGAAPVAAAAAKPASSQWDMNSFDDIPASPADGGLPDIDVEPLEVPKPAAAAPVAQPAAPVKPVTPVAQAIVPKVAAAAGSALEEQVRGPLTDAVREMIEKIVWEIVPELAETIIREELERLLKEKA